MSSAHRHHYAYLSKIPTTNSTDDATTSVVIHFGGPTYKKTRKIRKKGNTNNWKNKKKIKKYILVGRT
jgi:hypothetical protein